MAVFRAIQNSTFKIQHCYRTCVSAVKIVLSNRILPASLNHFRTVTVCPVGHAGFSLRYASADTEMAIVFIFSWILNSTINSSHQIRAKITPPTIAASPIKN
ncbi:MAG: hypothetical protein U5K34_14140 [Thiohalophilus sp.]|nr:hypothetical protein [Thiohalophilus sp.]MDZ7805114.1 hypothetical protein [Thiohalophilus sp.]